MSKAAVGLWLSGKRGESITAAQIDRIAAAVGRHPAWLLYGVETVHVDPLVREGRRLLEQMTPEQKAQAISVLRALAGEPTKPIVLPKAGNHTKGAAALALVSVNPPPQQTAHLEQWQGQLQRGQGSALMLGMLQADTLIPPWRGEIVQLDHAVRADTLGASGQFIVIAVLVFTVAHLIRPKVRRLLQRLRS